MKYCLLVECEKQAKKKIRMHLENSLDFKMSLLKIYAQDFLSGRVN